MKIMVTSEGLLIPKEVAERLGSDEVEVIEEPGRLVIVAGRTSLPDGERYPRTKGDDPILRLGQAPVRTGASDGSTHHDAYLYDRNA